VSRLVKVGWIEITPRGRIIGGGISAPEGMTAPSLVESPNDRIEVDLIEFPSPFELAGRAYDLETEEILPASELTAEFNSYTITVDQSATITLPEDTLIEVQGTLSASHTHPGGVFSFASEVPGVYMLLVDALPHQPRMYTIEVTI
jgi:hypothetical protein